jgi:hypothetical protein
MLRQQKLLSPGAPDWGRGAGGAARSNMVAAGQRPTQWHQARSTAVHSLDRHGRDVGRVCCMSTAARHHTPSHT